MRIRCIKIGIVLVLHKPKLVNQVKDLDITQPLACLSNTPIQHIHYKGFPQRTSTSLCSLYHRSLIGRSALSIVTRRDSNIAFISLHLLWSAGETCSSWSHLQYFRGSVLAHLLFLLEFRDWLLFGILAITFIVMNCNMARTSYLRE
jgi:hypothetical protein